MGAGDRDAIDAGDHVRVHFARKDSRANPLRCETLLVKEARVNIVCLGILDGKMGPLSSIHIRFLGLNESCAQSSGWLIPDRTVEHRWEHHLALAVKFILTPC